MSGADQNPPHQRLARLATEVLSPVPMAAALLVVIAVHSSPSTAAAVGWSLLAAIFIAVLPLAYLTLSVRHGRVTDRNVRLREQRPRVLLVGVGLVAIGIALLAWLGAPREIMALLGAMLVGLAVALVTALKWKLSLHAAGAAGTVVIVALVFGPYWLALFSLVSVVGWARVELGDHTPVQVVLGALIGAMVAGIIFTLLR